jgi:hypothetical protein
MRVIQAAVVGAAIVAAVTPIPPGVVESWYSTWFYPPVQRVLTPVTNLVPVSTLDVLIVAALVAAGAFVVHTVRGVRRERRVAPIGRAAARLLTAAAIVYLAFVLLWGFNYRRIPMSQRLAVAPDPPSSAAVFELGMQAVSEMNRLHAAAHRHGWSGDLWSDESLVGAFGAVQRALSDAPAAAPGRLKTSLLTPYFRWTGVDGMINPFGLEVIANPDLLPFERPFVAAHEWAHLAGYADESEANFVGWLACLHGEDNARYSGWLYLYWQVSGEVGDGERRQLAEALAPGPRRDVNAIIERLRREQWPLLRMAGWAVYDQYLKANRVDEGIRSYGAVVTLILRARFEDGWNPVRRSPESSR